MVFRYFSEADPAPHQILFASFRKRNKRREIWLLLRAN
jgi:hypothetical protein